MKVLITVTLGAALSVPAAVLGLTTVLEDGAFLVGETLARALDAAPEFSPEDPLVLGGSRASPLGAEPKLQADEAKSEKTKKQKWSKGPVERPEPAADMPEAVFVGQRTVLRLANAGVRPAAVVDPGSDERPAGLRLSGVSGLGLGVEDGDVVVAVSGAAVTSRADVVRAVLVARAERRLHVFGTLYRGQHPYRLIVEMPYPEPTPR